MSPRGASHRRLLESKAYVIDLWSYGSLTENAMELSQFSLRFDDLSLTRGRLAQRECELLCSVSEARSMAKA